MCTLPTCLAEESIPEAMKASSSGLAKCRKLAQFTQFFLTAYLIILSTMYCQKKIKVLKVIFYKAMSGTVQKCSYDVNEETPVNKLVLTWVNLHGTLKKL